MHLTAHVVRLWRYFFVIFFIGLSFFFTNFSVQKVQAQTTPQTATQTTSGSFVNPDVDANVPRDSHSYAQIVSIDVLSALICELSGIDPVPNHQCVTYNPATGKLGLMQQNPNVAFGSTKTTQPVGGLLGFIAGQISYLYQPTISSSTYFDYLSSNFGIVKHAYAANTQLTNCTNTTNGSFGYGYCGLNPIFNLWKMTRDFAYALLVIAFVVLALGIMLRFQAEPRVIMTLQNQIPRVIVAILLITFSYAIAGFMIDLMWTVTYMGINTITSGATGQACDRQGKLQPITNIAPINLLETPLLYVNTIFHRDCGFAHSGVGSIAWATGSAVSTTLTDLVAEFLGKQDLHCGLGVSVGPVDIGSGSIIDCIYEGIIWLVKLIATLIVIITLIVILVRLWFELLKCAVLLLIYTIGGPIWIVFGLIPGRPLGFEKWLRLMFAHLAAFPLVAFALVLARVLIDAYPDPSAPNFDPNTIFVPPLIGNPQGEGLGPLLAFGLILITPGIPGMIKERMKVPSGKMGQQIRQSIASGASVTRGIGGQTVARGFRRENPQTGQEAGALRNLLVGRIMTKNGKLRPTFKIFSKFANGASGNAKPH